MGLSIRDFWFQFHFGLCDERDLGKAVKRPATSAFRRVAIFAARPNMGARIVGFRSPADHVDITTLALSPADFCEDLRLSQVCRDAPMIFKFRIQIAKR